jgi:hypothetical protein
MFIPGSARVISEHGIMRFPCCHTGHGEHRMTRPAMPENMVYTGKAFIWVILGLLAALISYLSFRGYFAADMLIGFANLLHC